MESIIGHRLILDYLTTQVAKDRLTHAYLFAGPQHVGKTTVARWFAASLLCHGSQANSLFGAADAKKPCATCASCIALDKGLHADLHVLDVAEGEHSISIESMRTWLKSLSTSPNMGARKVALLHNAHALTTAAANAFLKTLEEASASTTIVVTTHQPHRLLPTILSRCQIVEFQKVPTGDAAINDPLWESAKGLPGRYMLNKNAGQDLLSDDRTFFEQIMTRRPGERFALIEPLFKKTSAHAEGKDAWKARLQVWQSELRDKLYEALQTPDALVSPPVIARMIDELYALQEASSAPINLRAHVESFLLSLPQF